MRSDPRSVALLLVAAPLASALPRTTQQEEDEQRVRHVYRPVEVVEVRPGGSAEAALRVYDAWMRGAGSADRALPEPVMVEMYRAAGNDGAAFKQVALLIQRGLDLAGDPPRHAQVTERHSVDMAQVRERWIQDLLLDIGRERGWRIARSDSGNTTSGMKSDLDQTLYVFEWDPEAGDWRRAPTRDAELIAAFRREWSARYPLSAEALDIASIEGRDRFPDPRDVEIEHYWNEHARTTDALRHTPGAYTFQGAVGQQMQFRALDALLKGNERAYRIYGPDAGPEGTWRVQPFDPDEALRTMFGVEPELLPGYAFGAALANYVELQHYLHAEKFESKYHLRTWEDAAHVLLLAERGQDKQHKVEFSDLAPERRRALNHEVLTRLFPGSDAETARRRRRHALAMEASADLRLIHKDRFPGDPARVFEPLAREMFGAGYRSQDPAQLEAAAREHRRLANEFCLETVYATSAEAFQTMLEPGAAHALDPERYRHLLPDRSEAEWQVFRERAGEAAHLSFLYGLFDLGAVKGAELLRRLDARFPGQRCDLLHLWAGRRAAGRTGPANVADVYFDHYREVLRTRAAELSARVQRHVAGELGFENVEQARVVDGLLDRHALNWSLGKVARNVVFDPGNLDAMANVLRVYFESKGDLDRTRAAIVDEVVLALPIAGQLVAATRGGLEGAVLMAAAVQFPVVGVGMVVCSLGEAGYAIYDVEVAGPRAGNAEDAIYRGFVGPETRSYGGEPRAFGDAEQARLDALEERRAELEPRIRRVIPQWSREPEDLRQWRDLIAAQEAERRLVEEVLVPGIAELREQRAQWERFRDGAWAGGYFFEVGAQRVQRPFQHHLLASLQPVVSYSPAGVIDLRAEWDPALDGARLADLERRLEVEPDALVLLESEAEYSELLLRRTRWERARRYLEQARDVPELHHRFLRDSLHPALIEWARARREEVRRTRGDAAAALVSPNPDAFLASFLEGNRGLLEELVAMELLEPDAYRPPEGARITYGGVFPPNELSRLPDDLRETLSRRLYSDVLRSRALWFEYRTRERAREARAALALEERLQAYRAEAAGLAVQELAGDPALAELLAAVRLAPRRGNPPTVEATLYRVTPEDGAAFDVVGRVAVNCDPTRYRPPYTARVAWLDGAQVRAALSSGAHEGEPLTPETARGLGDLLEQRGRELESGGLVALVRAFAAEVSRGAATPLAAPIRPVPKDGAARAGAGLEAPVLGPDAVLLGEVLAYAAPPRAPAEPEPEAPAEEGTVPALLLSELALTRSVQGANEQQALTSLGAGARLEAEDVSANLGLTLDIPERIQPGEPFSLGAHLRYATISAGEPLTVRLFGEELEAESVVPAGPGQGELALSVDHAVKLVGRKSYEWNYLYRREPRAGEPTRDPFPDHVITLRIRSDAPSFDGLEVAPEGEGPDADGIPRFTGATTWGPRFTAEVRRGDEVLLSLVVRPRWSLEGGLTLEPASGAGASLPGAAQATGGGGERAQGATGDPRTGGADRPGRTTTRGQRPSDPDAPPSTPAGAGRDGRPAWVAHTSLPPGSAAGAGALPAPADPLAVLRSPRPWEDARVRELIDEWLRVSEPDVRTGPEDTRRWQWTEWGQAVSPPSVIAAGPPEHGSMGRHECLFVVAGRMTSRGHHSLREYLERRLRGEDGRAPAGARRSALAETLRDAGRERNGEDGDQDSEPAAPASELEGMLSSVAAEDWVNGPPPSFTGKPVLMLINVTWAAQGRAAAERVQALADRWGPRGVAVIAVHPEPKAPVLRYAADHRLGLPIATDPGGAVARDLGIDAFPVYVVYDAGGAVVGFGTADDLDRAEGILERHLPARDRNGKRTKK